MPVLRLFLLAIVKTLTKVFGLATVSLFGRVPTRDADRCALVGLLALTWLPAVAAVIIPGAAEMLIPFAPDDEGMLRILAVVSALVMPLGVGAMVGSMHNHRGLGRSHRLRETLRGFRYTPVIAFTVVAVLLVLPPMAIVRILRGWDAGRLMVRVPGDDPNVALDHVIEVLEGAGHAAQRREPPRALAKLFRALGHVLADIFRLDVAHDLAMLEGHDRDDGPFEITLHAADLAIIGPREQITRVHATLAEGLDLRRIGLTWDDDTIAMEREIGQLQDRVDADEDVDLEDIGALVTRLGSSGLDDESWSGVRRALHRLERDVLRARLELPPPHVVAADHVTLSTDQHG